jgi:hypothetical protein
MRSNHRVSQKHQGVRGKELVVTTTGQAEIAPHECAVHILRTIFAECKVDERTHRKVEAKLDDSGVVLRN